VSRWKCGKEGAKEGMEERGRQICRNKRKGKMKFKWKDIRVANVQERASLGHD